MIKNNLASEKNQGSSKNKLLYAYIGLYKSQLTHECTISATVLIDFVITEDNIYDKKTHSKAKKLHRKTYTKMILKTKVTTLTHCNMM